MKVVVTGSAGLVGSAVVRHFHTFGHNVVGVDSHVRSEFLGKDADTSQISRDLVSELRGYRTIGDDIRNRQAMSDLIRAERPDLVVHAAAQPSHDVAARIPFADFETNAVGTLNLLEATRAHAPEAVFVFVSTNKVYGDAPNRLRFREEDLRWDFSDDRWKEGIDESLSVDGTMHSLFGVSKLAGDVLVQEYGRYFGMRTCSLRCGCITGKEHRAVELHGFLRYLVSCALSGRPYTIFGFGGKQVRDQLHASDLARAVELIAADPPVGEAYNMGGGRSNSISILEAARFLMENYSMRLEWRQESRPRLGDHRCYISDTRKFRKDFPGWEPSLTLEDIFRDLL